MNQDWTVIDGLQYSAWSREIFEQMRAGGLNCVHVTIAYHENTKETLTRFGEWNQRFESMPDLIRPPVVFLPDRTGRNIFLGHGKGGAVVQNQSLETTACHGVPVH